MIMMMEGRVASCHSDYKSESAWLPAVTPGGAELLDLVSLSVELPT